MAAESELPAAPAVRMGSVSNVVEVEVPPGPLGMLIMPPESPDNVGCGLLKQFAPVDAQGTPGILEKQGVVRPGSLLFRINDRDFRLEKASFKDIQDEIKKTRLETRLLAFELPPSSPTSSSTSSNNFDLPMRSMQAFHAAFTLGKELGRGTFSVVKAATHNKTKETVAVKCINRQKLSKSDEAALSHEVGILQRMDHKHIMKLFEVFGDDQNVYLVTEFMPGGELFDRIVERTFYSEHKARELVRVLLETIQYCHDRGVVHRDLKPENLLLSSTGDDAEIKIADFGFAKSVFGVDDVSTLETQCGTPAYVAPEILQQKAYGKSVDIWSIGVITYILLCGYPPFNHSNHAQLYRLIRSGQYEFESPDWDGVSDQAKDLITHMLMVNPEERWDAARLLQHPWLSDASAASDVELGDVLARLKARRKFRKAVNTIMSMRFMKPSGNESSVVK